MKIEEQRPKQQVVSHVPLINWLAAPWACQEVIQQLKGDWYEVILSCFYLCLFYFSCHQTEEIEEYKGFFNNKIYPANGQQIYKRTGCLPKCDKYTYTLKPTSDLTKYGDGYDKAVKFLFFVSTGETEVREQVTKKQQLHLYINASRVVKDRDLDLTKRSTTTMILILLVI